MRRGVARRVEGSLTLARGPVMLQRVISRAAALTGTALLVAGCTSKEFSTSSQAVDVHGSITALVGSAQWSGTKTVKATFQNGNLTIVGEDAEFATITILLIGIDSNPAQADSARVYRVTAETGNTAGYCEYNQQLLSTNIRYSTLPGGNGLITLTHVSPGRVAGTFSCQASLPPNSTYVPSVVSIGNGAFDIRP